MKNLIFPILLMACFTGFAQQYNPQNAGAAAAYNAPLAIIGAPLDARSYYYDTAKKVLRPYLNTAEVLVRFADTASRKGQFSVVVNTGGTLSPSLGVVTGGNNEEWWFRDGVADSDLVQKTSTHKLWNGTISPYNNRVITDSTLLSSYEINQLFQNWNVANNLDNVLSHGYDSYRDISVRGLNGTGLSLNNGGYVFQATFDTASNAYNIYSYGNVRYNSYHGSMFWEMLYYDASTNKLGSDTIMNLNSTGLNLLSGLNLSNKRQNYSLYTHQPLAISTPNMGMGKIFTSDENGIGDWANYLKIGKAQIDTITSNIVNSSSINLTTSIGYTFSSSLNTSTNHWVENAYGALDIKSYLGNIDFQLGNSNAVSISGTSGSLLIHPPYNFQMLASDGTTVHTSISNAGVVKLGNLAGTATNMVTVTPDGTLGTKQLPPDYKIVSTYADMLALPSQTTLLHVKVVNDEHKNLPATRYEIWPDGDRIYLTTVKDN